jgi:hypothetical protein
VHYNDRNQAIYRCRHRGQGCAQSGRSANGLHRAAVLGLRVLASDLDLQEAIRTELTSHRHQPVLRGPSAESVITSLKLKQRKLLDLYYADKVDQDIFAEESTRLTTQQVALQSEIEANDDARRRSEHAADKFEHVAALLNDM